MKKELKRYMLVESAGSIKRQCNSKKEYDELINKINKYNNKKKSKYLFGNISYVIEDGIYYVLINRYNKLTNKAEISVLDELTSRMNESELINFYSDKLRTNPIKNARISIAYLADKSKKDKTNKDYDRRIKTIDVLYADDRKYLSKNYVMKCIKYQLSVNDYDFFYDLIDRFSCNKVIEEDIEKLRIAIDNIKNGLGTHENIYNIVFKLYDHLVYERDKNSKLIRDENGCILKSRRRIRDFGFFVKNYGMLDKKKIKPDIADINQFDIYDEDDMEQEELALFKWDQDNDISYDDYEVRYDKLQRKFIKLY